MRSFKTMATFATYGFVALYTLFMVLIGYTVWLSPIPATTTAQTFLANAVAIMVLTMLPSYLLGLAWRRVNPTLNDAFGNFFLGGAMFGMVVYGLQVLIQDLGTITQGTGYVLSAFIALALLVTLLTEGKKYPSMAWKAFHPEAA